MAIKIEQNTLRYISLFSNVIDKIIPNKPLILNNQTNSYDILLEHRNQLKQKKIEEYKEHDETLEILEKTEDDIPKILSRK
jgi:hypothetical protein